MTRESRGRTIARAVVAAFVCLGAVAFAPRAADACTCVSGGPACQVFWGADAVFDGTVVKIVSEVRPAEPPERFPLSRLVVTLEVRQSWKGVDTARVDVVTNASGASCGFNFEMGRRYLVFGRYGGADSRLGVSMCSRTREYDGSSEDVAFLASLGLPETGARVFGTTDVFQRSFTTETKRQHAELEIRLTGNGRTISTKSIRGRYEFGGVQPGQYELRAVAPDGFVAWGETRTVEIPNARACAEENFNLTPNGRIAGRLVDAAGRGVPKVQVELAAEGADLDARGYLSTVSVTSGTDGNFELAQLPPGRYIVGLNLRDLPTRYQPYARSLFPGGTAPPLAIALALGEAVDLGRWEVPPALTVVTLTGQIVWKDGTPVPGATVRLLDLGQTVTSQGRFVDAVQTAADGRFVVAAFEGRRYQFSATVANRSQPLSALQIEARAGLGPVTLIIQLDPPR